VETGLYAYYFSTIRIVGTGFAVDETPVPFGDLTAASGTLTGTLLSGDPIDNVFSGNIVLLENPPLTILVNNGLAPPNPENVIDDATHEEDNVYVRNAGCPAEWAAGYPGGNCPSPGPATAVELRDAGAVWDLLVYDASSVTLNGGEVNNLSGHDFSTITMSGGTVDDYLEAYNSSTITMTEGTVETGLYAYDFSTVMMNGGRVWDELEAYFSSNVTMSGGTVGGDLKARDFSTITMSGGTVDGYLEAYNPSSTITMSGGTVDGYLQARDFSTITIVGTDFEVDGAPVRCGDLTKQTGTLTGTLASGDPINNVFYQGGWRDDPCTTRSPCNGTICLEDSDTTEQECPVPEPTQTLLYACALATLALLRRRARWCSSP
jgi:hypothetical protein